MLHTKYQGSRPCGFRQDFFHIASVKHVTPGLGHFWPQGYNLNKLDRGLLGDTIYQISRVSAYWFQTRRFLKFSSRKSIFSHFDLDMQQTRTIWTILVEGHPRIICVKLFRNWARGFGGVVKSFFNRRTTEADRSKKLNLSLCDRWANKKYLCLG